MKELFEAARAGATVGEMSDVFRREFGIAGTKPGQLSGVGAIAAALLAPRSVSYR